MAYNYEDPALQVQSETVKYGHESCGHSNVLDVRSIRAADCVTDYYLVVAKVREILAVGTLLICQITATG
jgi:hypothetical protein